MRWQQRWGGYEEIVKVFEEDELRRQEREARQLPAASSNSF